MKKIMFFIVILTAICMTIGCSKAEKTKPEPVKISINVWPGQAHAFIAQEKGFFKKNNVNVELFLKRNITDSRQLYRDGEVDGLFDVFSDIIMLNSEGIQTRVVYITDYSESGDVIIGRPECSSLSDLKDKKVSFEGVNSFSHMFVLKALESVGINEYDVKFANIRAFDVLTALEEGIIDAGQTWEPVTTQALKKGYKIISKAGDFPGIITDVLAFRENVVKERPDDIQRIVKAMFEALDFMYSQKKEALEIASKAKGMSVEQMEQGIKGVHHLDAKKNRDAMDKSNKAESLYISGRSIMEFYARRGQLSRMLDLDTIIDPRFVNQIPEGKK